MIERRTVEAVARLARIALSTERMEVVARDLAAIIEFAQALQAVDVTGIPPLSHAVSESGWRTDLPEPSLSVEEALGNAPAAEDGFFEVPRVIEEA